MRSSKPEDSQLKAAAGAACEHAQEALANQTKFILDQEQWDQFMALLDRPAQVKPRLNKLFTEPHIARRR